MRFNMVVTNSAPLEMKNYAMIHARWRYGCTARCHCAIMQRFPANPYFHA